MLNNKEAILTLFRRIYSSVGEGPDEQQFDFYMGRKSATHAACHMDIAHALLQTLLFNCFKQQCVISLEDDLRCINDGSTATAMSLEMFARSINALGHTNPINKQRIQNQTIYFYNTVCNVGEKVREKYHFATSGLTNFVDYTTCYRMVLHSIISGSIEGLKLPDDIKNSEAVKTVMQQPGLKLKCFMESIPSSSADEIMNNLKKLEASKDVLGRAAAKLLANSGFQREYANVCDSTMEGFRLTAKKYFYAVVYSCKWLVTLDTTVKSKREWEEAVNEPTYSFRRFVTEKMKEDESVKLLLP